MNWDSLSAELQRTGVDLLIGTSPENIRYATGYNCFQGVWNRFAKAVVVSPARRRPVLVLPVAEAPRIAGSETLSDRAAQPHPHVSEQNVKALAEADPPG